MTRDELLQQYEETLDRITKEAYDAREKARATLRKQLKALHDQKTKMN